MSRSVEEIMTMIKANNIEMLDFKMVEINGQFRHVTIPAKHFSEETLTEGIGFDASNYGYAVVEKSDMVFIPDPDTAIIDPFCAVPKLVYGEAGNGMHVHMLLMKDGEPVFSDDNGYSHLSETAHYFMGGLLKHIASLCAITNPSTNSFKRLVPGFEAPVTVGYATSNRSAVIRIPAYAKIPHPAEFERYYNL